MTKEVIDQALEALEEIRNALAWFYDSYPQDVTKKGNDLLPHVETVLTALREARAEQPSPTITPEHLLALAQAANLGLDKVIKAFQMAAPAQQEPVAWVPYLSDRADGVSGHYAIARWNPRGYREVWNLRRHAWGAYSDDVLSLEEADTLLRLIEIPTRKVETPQPAQPQQEPVAQWQKKHAARTDGKWENANEHDAKWWRDNAQGWEIRALYTSPPAQRTWVRLTDEEIEKGRDQTFSTNNPYCPCDSKTMLKAARWAEAKSKEKNA